MLTRRDCTTSSGWRPSIRIASTRRRIRERTKGSDKAALDIRQVSETIAYVRRPRFGNRSRDLIGQF